MPSSAYEILLNNLSAASSGASNKSQANPGTGTTSGTRSTPAPSQKSGTTSTNTAPAPRTNTAAPNNNDDDGGDDNHKNDKKNKKNDVAMPDAPTSVVLTPEEQAALARLQVGVVPGAPPMNINPPNWYVPWLGNAPPGLVDKKLLFGTPDTFSPGIPLPNQSMSASAAGDNTMATSIPVSGWGQFTAKSPYKPIQNVFQASPAQPTYTPGVVRSAIVPQQVKPVAPTAQQPAFLVPPTAVKPPTDYTMPAFTQPNYTGATYPSLGDDQFARLLNWNTQIALPWAQEAQGNQQFYANLDEVARNNTFNQNYQQQTAAEDARRYNLEQPLNAWQTIQNTQLPWEQMKTNTVESLRDYDEKVRQYNEQAALNAWRTQNEVALPWAQYQQGVTQYNQDYTENQRRFNEQMAAQRVADQYATFSRGQAPNARFMSFR